MTAKNPGVYAADQSLNVCLTDGAGNLVNLSASGITISTSVITGGTDTRVLFDDAGTVGENSAFTFTKASGLLKSTALALGGATIGSNALAVTGQVSITSGNKLLLVGASTIADASTGLILGSAGSLRDSGSGNFDFNNAAGTSAFLRIATNSSYVGYFDSAGNPGVVFVRSNPPVIKLGVLNSLTWTNNADANTGTSDLFLTRAAAATLQHGAADVSSGAVAQTITFQGNTGASGLGPLALIKGALGGTSGTGGEVRIQGGLASDAAGTGGAITFYTAAAGAGTTPVLAMTINSAGLIISNHADSTTIPFFTSVADTTTGTTPRNAELDFIVSGSRAGYFNSSGLQVISQISTNAQLNLFNLTGIPAGGTTSSGLRFSSTSNFGVFFGSGAPSLSAAKGSLYLRSDGSGVNDRMYVNTDGGTTWTAVVTVG